MSEYNSNIFHIQRPVPIPSLAGRFVYRKFQKDEYTDSDSDESKKVAGYWNRWIELDMSDSSNTSIKNGWLDNYRSESLELGKHIISEADLNLGVVKTVTISREEKEYIKGFFGPNSAGRSPYQEFLIAYLGGYNTSGWPEFTEDADFPEVDITTGKLVVEKTLDPDYFQKPSWLSEYTCDSIAGSILRNPLSEDEDAYKFYELMALTSRRRQSESSKRFVGASVTKLLGSSTNELSIINLNTDDYSDGDLIGYAILKYSNGSFVSMQIIGERKFYDYKVAYGKTYRYVVLPIKATLSVSSVIIPVICNDEISITIEATEEIPPEPPTSINIKWLENDLYNIKWNLGAKRISITREEPDEHGVNTFEESPEDTKGVQVFVRNSLLEPFTLVRYIDFNDVEPPQYRELADENIPAEYILRVDPNSSVRRTQYNIRLRPNTDHYIALCAIDAHGNSSAYSEQYKLRRNSVTGEVDITLISPAKAPKTQPNLLLREPLVESSFTAHRYSHASIYVNPDLSGNVPDDGENVQFEFFDVNSDVSDSFFITVE